MRTESARFGGVLDRDRFDRMRQFPSLPDLVIASAPSGTVERFRFTAEEEWLSSISSLSLMLAD